MPLEVRIDVVPRGIETDRQQIGLVHIRQVKQLDDDPEGERLYHVSGQRWSTVQHRRGDGAMALVAKALAADTGELGVQT